MKKQTLQFSALALLFTGLASAQVGINTTTPHPSAALDVVVNPTTGSTAKGFLMPRVDTATRTAMFATADATASGMQVKA